MKRDSIVFEQMSIQSFNTKKTDSKVLIYSLILFLAANMAAQLQVTQAYADVRVDSHTFTLMFELSTIVFAMIAYALIGEAGDKFYEQNILLSKVGIMPGLYFAIANLTMYLGFHTLDPLTFNLISLSSILFTAMFMKLVLGTKLTNIQIYALITLVLSGVLIAVDKLGEKAVDPHGGSDSHEANYDYKYGISVVLVSCVFNAIAAVVVQQALQNEENLDIFIFAFWLCVYQAIAYMLIMAMKGRWVTFAYMTSMTTIPILNMSVGHILTALCIKKGDAMSRQFAFMLSIVLIGLVDAIVFGKFMSILMLISSCACLWSVYAYNTYTHIHTYSQSNTLRSSTKEEDKGEEGEALKLKEGNKEYGTFDQFNKSFKDKEKEE